MSWIQKLYETYNNCIGKIGYSNNPKERPLLPVCHITTQAHIEIVVDGGGNFQEALLIRSKENMATIIPSTESSAGRAGSKPANHPLCDKLQYVAGDFREFGGTVTSGFAEKEDEPFRSYMETLEKWCQSEFKHPKAEAVLNYIKKKTVIQDLHDHKIIFLGSDGYFSKREEVQREKDAVDIFSVINDQEQAFVRWIVEIPGERESRVWRDKTLWDSWTKYYLKSREKEPFCFVTGKDDVLASKHPKYIRREGDRAKLISSNDKSGFTFRGRFLTDQQACNVSLEVSQKAHYALLWLISRQGHKNGDQVIVAWATSGDEIPQPMDELIDTEDLIDDESPEVDTYQDLAIKLKRKIAGYNQKIDPLTDIVVMGIDSATPGRMAITYYRTLKSSDFLERLERWHDTCAWFHSYRFVDRQKVPFVGAPAPRDIAEAAYGKRVTDTLRKKTVERILPCIIDSQPIPRDLVESAVRRASNRLGMRDPKDKHENEWHKTFSIACALYKKLQEGKEKFDMALDANRNTRDYLYGRLLAIADRLEEVALHKAEKGRATNATRYMQQFSQHPYRTWVQIHSALIPYMVRLDGAFFYKNLIAEVKDLFSPEDFMNDKPLSGEYLLGYYSQRQILLPKRKHKDNDDTADGNVVE